MSQGATAAIAVADDWEAPRSVSPVSPPRAARTTAPVLDCDVVLVSGGNAGLCAAISAAGLCARVVVLERSPCALCGGNSRHTRNLRRMHDAPTDFLTDAYSEEEYAADLMRVTGGRTDEAPARLVVRASSGLPVWLRGVGVRFQRPLRGTLQLGPHQRVLPRRRHSARQQPGGRGRASRHPRRLSRRRRRDVVDGSFRSAPALVSGHDTTTRAKAIVLAGGGFESNLEWLSA